MWRWSLKVRQIIIQKLKLNESNMKYIKVRQNSIKAMQGFCDAVDKTNTINAFNNDLTLDPNIDYNIGAYLKTCLPNCTNSIFSKDRPI